MKNLARFASVAAVLGTALLFSGCTTQTVRAPRVEPAMTFSVVESSTNKELTPAEAAELQAAVINYLQSQGFVENKVYYVKVSYVMNPEDEPQWAIVRLANVPARTYTVLASYAGADDYYPYDYYRYGYASSYGQFSRFGYYDPFDYNYGGYSGPVRPRDHSKPDKPDDRPHHPPGTHTRWENPGVTNPDQPRRHDYPPRTGNPERWARERDTNRGGSNRHSSSGGRGGDSPAPRATPPPPSYRQPDPVRSEVVRSEPVRSEPARSDPPSRNREEGNRSLPQTNEK